MKSPSFIVVLLLMTTFSFAQEKCETPTENLHDPNAITITKCSIDDVKSTLESEEVKEIATKRHRKLRKVNAISTSNQNQVTQQLIENKEELVEELSIKKDILTTLKKVPFHLVEQIPLFDKCEKAPILKQSKCFEEQMIKHIVRNFDYPKEAMQKGIEGKVLVQFTIDTDGNVIDIKKRGPENGELLEKEADRLIASLPKFIPGSHKGNFVNVKYALPIIFKAPKR
ncbi:energy transducer TonB [Tenacibaculum crassostreae]|uniref:energy transducer TonB n=1 Tax=Tenacibaculum crassostreae TaxID=502683 RepID=UPI0038936FC4